MKRFRVNYGVGRAKYLISYHDGIKKHKDGSDFFDISIFSRQRDFHNAIKNLLANDYKRL